MHDKWSENRRLQSRALEETPAGLSRSPSVLHWALPGKDRGSVVTGGWFPLFDRSARTSCVECTTQNHEPKNEELEIQTWASIYSMSDEQKQRTARHHNTHNTSLFTVHFKCWCCTGVKLGLVGRGPTICAFETEINGKWIAEWVKHA